MKVVEKLLGVFQCMGFSRSEMLELFEQWIQREKEVSIDLVKAKLQQALQDPDFEWVKLALDTKFVYGIDAVDAEKLNVDNLLIFTDIFPWKDIVFPDALLSIGQKDELKEQFREIGVQGIRDIHELFSLPEFDCVPFEVKHAYKSRFGSISYVNEDIIFYLKKIVWDHLYPNSFGTKRSLAVKAESLIILENQKNNEGWTEMAHVLESIKDIFPGIELYELSKVDWGEKVHHKNHYRNLFTLGFKRVY